MGKGGVGGGVTALMGLPVTTGHRLQARKYLLPSLFLLVSSFTRGELINRGKKKKTLPFVNLIL